MIFLEYSLFVSLLLIISSLSHIADIPDIKEDEENNINTPAVILGEKNSYIFAYSLLIASVFTHGTQGNNLMDIFYDVFSVLTVTSFINNIQLSFFTFLLLLGYYKTQEYFLYNFITELFRLSDNFHSLATSSLPWIIHNTENLNPETRKFSIKNWINIMSYGDKMGGELLNCYTDVVKNTFDFMI